MRVVTIVGSPKKRGNTGTVVDWLEQGLVARGHAFERIHAADHRIECCKGCGACQQADQLPGCVQTDDGSALLRRVAAGDVVVFATPLYGWGYAAQIKPLVDRQFSMAQGFSTPAHRSALEGKRLALLVTCAGEDDGNADLLRTQFERMAGRYLKARSIHKYVLPRCRPIDQEAAQALAERMASELSQEPVR